MEQNLPIIAKKVWNIVRVMFYMLRKGISKGKLMAEFNMMLKRGKIAGKALQNLMFHHSHHFFAISRRSNHHHNHHISFPMPLNEYEFSCSNSPIIHLPFHLNNKHKSKNLFSFGAQLPLPTEDDFAAMNAVVKALEMINSEGASPALPGFGRSPLVRQLRITDSPFPLRDVDDGDNHVDVAAEEFITRFYKDLRSQSGLSY